MINVKEKFKELNSAESFQRVDAVHKLHLYIGRDAEGHETIALRSKEKPKMLLSSKSIKVSILQRDDNDWMLAFHLIEKDKAMLFYVLCDDMIESSRCISDISMGADFISNRFAKWQKMFAKTRNGLLTEPEIKGLIGELVYIESYLIPKYDQNNTLSAWIGPEKADQDFIFKDKWYEVKTTSSGGEAVNISSIEQLEQDEDGELGVVFADKTSMEDLSRVSLNSIIKDLTEKFEEHGLTEKFINILFDFGYVYREEYDEYVYKINGIKNFVVESEFPKLRRNQLDHAIINANYSLSLAAIKEFEITQGE